MAHRGQFRAGQSGNPSGKAKGTRHRASLAVEALLDGEAEALTRRAIEMALDGDGPAMRLCLDRLCPPRKDRTIAFTLPEITGPADLTKATAALLKGVADGELTPGEAAELSRLVDAHTKAIETADFAARLAALEQAAGGRP